MANPTQRWFFSLSLCLLLQQFAPSYTVHVKTMHDAHQDDYDNNNNSGQAIGEKRTLISAAKFIGKHAIQGVTFTANAVNFGATVVQAIGDCEATQPGIEDDWQRFQDMKQEYDSIGIQIREISSQAEARQIIANDTFYHYRETRDVIRGLADEQARVLKSIDPQVAIEINNVADRLELIFQNANKTNAKVDVLKIDTEFATGLELGLRLAFTSAAVAMPGWKLLWKNYLKEATIGQRITGFIEKFNTRVADPVKSSGKNALSKLLSRGILGKIRSKITARLEGIITRVAPKFSKAKKLFKLARSGLVGVVRVGVAALAIWEAIQTFETCKLKADEARDSVANMTQALKDIKGHLQEVEEANQNVQDAWIEVYNTTMEDKLLNTLEDMRSMMLEDYFSPNKSNAKEKNEVAEVIKEYMEVKDMNPDEESTKRELSTRLRAMNFILGTVTVTLSCFRHKGNAFGAIKLECARGDSPFPYIYSDIVNKVPIDPEKECLQRTGEEYITEERMKEAWTKWVEGNGTDISEACLMNNKIKVRQVEDFLRKGEKDARTIAEDFLQKDKINKGGVEEVQAMIDKIKEENPNIENEMTDDDKDTLCQLKLIEEDPQKLLDFARAVLRPGLTMEVINSVKCESGLAVHDADDRDE